MVLLLDRQGVSQGQDVVCDIAIRQLVDTPLARGRLMRLRDLCRKAIFVKKAGLYCHKYS